MADITDIHDNGEMIGQIIAVMCPEGFQIFWKGGVRSPVYTSWARARDAARVYYPGATFRHRPWKWHRSV